jgi:Carboxypeptidase regulatory-like domain
MNRNFPSALCFGSRFRRLILNLFLLALATPVLFAQIDRAVLEGTVTDPSERVIFGATVKALAVDTGIVQQQATNSKGYYRFPGLAVGHYTVTATGAGFKTKVIEDVILQVGQTRTLDSSLQVGTTTEMVDVRATNAPSERSSAEAATVIRSDQIENLPNNGRDWASFTLLAPFAQDDGGGDQRTIRFAGRARDDNNFQIDGVDAGCIQEQAQKSQTRLQISQDAIEEYRVNSALYDAEYGTQAGGQIDVETKRLSPRSLGCVGARFAAWNGQTTQATRFASCGRSGSRPRVNPRKSKAPVPVIAPMQKLLDQYRGRRGNPASGPIFATMKGNTPLSLNNVLNRQILPVLNVCVCGKAEDEHEKEDHTYERGARPEWHGWHAFRCGLATNLHSLGVPDKTIQAILRHANVQVTQNSYVKTLDSQSIAAMRQLESLVDVKLLSANSESGF